MKKTTYYILDIVLLLISYLLSDFITSKSTTILGIIVGLISYIIMFYLLNKKYKNKY